MPGSFEELPLARFVVLNNSGTKRRTELFSSENGLVRSLFN
jgi:hypothetical protein